MGARQSVNVEHRQRSSSVVEEGNDLAVSRLRSHNSETNDPDDPEVDAEEFRAAHNVRFFRASTFMDALTAGFGAAEPGPSTSGLTPNSRLNGLRFFVSSGRDVKCPMCNKRVNSDDAEMHVVICMTKPKIYYNEDVLLDDKGECAICLDEMNTGCTIARLPCLCIYHKACIDEWFQRKNCCPEHPGD